jgi:hypothetical protein
VPHQQEQGGLLFQWRRRCGFSHQHTA